MIMLIDYEKCRECKNEEAWYTCLKCTECGRVFDANGFMIDDGGTHEIEGEEEE